jgi:hypothetical protein
MTSYQDFSYDCPHALTPSAGETIVVNLHGVLVLTAVALGVGMRIEIGSGRHGCKSRKVKVLPPSIACRTASMPDACIGNDA